MRILSSFSDLAVVQYEDIVNKSVDRNLQAQNSERNLICEIA